MRLSNSEHESHAWRIQEIAPDFRLEDAWALPARGAAEDFPRLLEVMASLDPAGGGSRATRALFAIRYRVGGWLGWDDRARELPVPQRTETTLRTRLPEDLRDSAAGAGVRSGGFRPLYRTDVEAASEISNGTVHAVMHLAWVRQDDGLYRGQMGVYVKPRGRLGAVYMAAIAPFRHHVVYPALMRGAWNARMPGERRSDATS
jgi:hypothetical protein